MKFILSVITASAILLLSGCATSGTKLEQSKVDQIKKGVTTRAEVETLLGPPTSVAMMGDGRRMLFYRYLHHQQKGVLVNIFSSIAGVAGPAGSLGAAGATVATSGEKNQTQSLTIRVSKDGVVEDYEYSDKTADTSMTLEGAKTTTTEKAKP